jgi:hypothetical protein
MCHSQKELVCLWDDPQVIPAADSDDDAPPTSERVSHFLKNDYLYMNNLLKAVLAQDTSLIEIGHYRQPPKNSAASAKPNSKQNKDCRLNFHWWAVQMIQTKSLAENTLVRAYLKQKLLATFQNLTVQQRQTITPFEPNNYFKLNTNKRLPMENIYADAELATSH